MTNPKLFWFLPSLHSALVFPFGGHQRETALTPFFAYRLFKSSGKLAVKNLPANAGDIRDVGSITGLGRFPGGGHANPLQCSCLENPMDRGAWRATIQGIAKSQMQMKQLSTAQHAPS